MTPIRPLFVAYPDLQASIPVIDFAQLPTPIEHKPINVSDSQTIHNLWIKRDDQSHAIYGGNKVRKLEFILADIKRRGMKKLLTFGGIGTNHGVATSLFCKQYDIDCHVFIFDQPVSSSAVNNLKLMASFGAKLKHKGSLFRTALHYYLRQLFLPSRYYYLPAGGSNLFGCIGFVNAAFELKHQIENGELDEPDFIYCPVSSTGSLAGLSLGCQLAGINSKVVGVRVSPSHLGVIPACTSQTVMTLAQQTYVYLKNKDSNIPNIKLNKIELEESFYGTGYGDTTPESLAATDVFARNNIKLDPTYTAKAAAAVLKFCHDQPDKKVLYWHTYNSSDVSKLMDATEFERIPKSLKHLLVQSNSQ